MDAGCCFLSFLCCYENKLRNRGAVLRGDEVEKELHNGGSKRGCMRRNLALLICFQSVRLAKHDISFISRAVFVVHTGAA